jgi:hypothetical protein
VVSHPDQCLVALDNAKTSIGSIQRLLSHENRTTTEIYLHSIGESERETMSILDREIGDGFQRKPHTNPHTEARAEIKKDLSYTS